MDKKTLSRYIRGVASEKERREVLLWTEASPENLATYRFLQGVYASNIAQQSPASESAQATDASRQSGRTRSRAFAPAFAFAVCCAVLLVGLLLFRPSGPVSVQSVCAPVGQQTKVDLSDGTEVWLNSGSSIEFGDLDKQRVRQVYLTGEAFFSVAKDPRRPFVVHTPDFNVKVLGTRFNVNTYNAEKTVVLVDGEVNVLRGRDSFSISPGEMYSYDSGAGVSSVHDIDTANYVSWVNGYLLFDDIPLGVVLTQLQSFFGADFRYDAHKASLTRVSGKLELRDGLETALLNLQNTAILSYVRKDDRTVDIIIND